MTLLYSVGKKTHSNSGDISENIAAYTNYTKVLGITAKGLIVISSV